MSHSLHAAGCCYLKPSTLNGVSLRNNCRRTFVLIALQWMESFWRQTWWSRLPGLGNGESVRWIGSRRWRWCGPWRGRRRCLYRGWRLQCSHVGDCYRATTGLPGQAAEFARAIICRTGGAARISWTIRTGAGTHSALCKLVGEHSRNITIIVLPCCPIDP